MRALIKVSEYAEYPGMINIFWDIVMMSGCKIKDQATFGDDHSAIHGKFLMLDTDSKIGEWTNDSSVAQEFMRTAVGNCQTLNFDANCRIFVQSVTETCGLASKLSAP